MYYSNNKCNNVNLCLSFNINKNFKSVRDSSASAYTDSLVTTSGTMSSSCNRLILTGIEKL